MIPGCAVPERPLQHDGLLHGRVRRLQGIEANQIRVTTTGCNKLNVLVACSPILETTGPIKLKFYRHGSLIGTNFVSGLEKTLNIQKLFVTYQIFSDNRHFLLIPGQPGPPPPPL